MEKTDGAEAGRPIERLHADPPDVLASERGRFLAVIERAGLPAEISSKLRSLVEQYITVAGRVSGIAEYPDEVWKTVKDADGHWHTFIFPTAENLDRDAASTNPAEAKEAKRLKRFEKRFDDALNHHLKIIVSIEPDPLMPDVDKKYVKAADIFGVEVQPYTYY